jgi:hypothetical protein
MDIEQIRASERGTAGDAKNAAKGIGAGFLKLGVAVVVLSVLALMVMGAFTMIGTNDAMSQRRVDARMAVQAELKDPDSAQFRNIVASETAACGEVNAKNAFGGYVGYTRFIYVGSTVLMEYPNDGGMFEKMWGKTCSTLK